MQLSLTGHHVDITDPLRTYVEDKVSKLERHFDHVSNVHVILSVEKLIQKAEATVHISGADVFADSEHKRGITPQRIKFIVIRHGNYREFSPYVFNKLNACLFHGH